VVHDTLPGFSYEQLKVKPLRCYVEIVKQNTLVLFSAGGVCRKTEGHNMRETVTAAKAIDPALAHISAFYVTD